MKILIIEDDPTLGPSLKARFDRRGFKTLVAPDESTARELFGVNGKK